MAHVNRVVLSADLPFLRALQHPPTHTRGRPGKHIVFLSSLQAAVAPMRSPNLTISRICWNFAKRSMSLYRQVALPTTLTVSHTEPKMRPRRRLSTLRRRHMQRRDDHAPPSARVSFDLDPQDRDIFLRPLHLEDSLRRNSESMSSSMGGVITVKSASMTIGSTSIAPRSENGFLGEGRTGNRSSHYSDARRSLDRGSLDSHRGPLGPVIDESAWLRSLQRRKIVEELIGSEEGYISDLKVLINVSWYDGERRMTLT
jgi:hypothetical protein